MPTSGSWEAAYCRHASHPGRASTSELSTTTSPSSPAARRPRLTLAANPAFSLAGYDLDAGDPPQLGEVLWAARVVGDDDASHAAGNGLADAPDKRCHPIGVAEARDHDADGPAVLPIPGHRAAHVAVARVGAKLQTVLERREAQGKCQRTKEQRAPPEVVVGQVDAPAQTCERPRERAVERRRSDRLRSSRWRCRVLWGVVVGHGVWSGTWDRSAGASKSSGAKPARRSSDSRHRTAGGSRSAREPSSAPVRRTTW